MGLIKRYTNWLHGMWPAGTVEKMPAVDENGESNVQGLYIVGDLTGIPLLKFSSDTGAKAVQRIAADEDFKSRQADAAVKDIAIIGAGVSGMAAMLEAKKQGLDAVVIEATEAFSTIINFPKAKPIYTYPTELIPAGDIQFTERSNIKEGLVEELQELTQEIVPLKAEVESVKKSGSIFHLTIPDGFPIKAHRVIVAIGRSGKYRELGVAGEDKDKVFNRLHDPKEFKGKKVLVVGGGDSALEGAVAMAQSGAEVSLSYRKAEFSRPKPENTEQITALASDNTLNLFMGSNVRAIENDTVALTLAGGEEERIENDVVFSMIGREAPLDFFRRSGVNISGEWRMKTWLSFMLFFGFCIFLYHWKVGGYGVYNYFASHNWFPFNQSGGNPKSIIGSILIASKDPGFYYSFAYCLCVGVFGVKRIYRRKTPYVKVQTLTLMAVQFIPLFILPYVIFPWMGHNGLFEAGFGKWFGDTFFPNASYWRAFGFILAWPLFIWNVFTPEPVWGWLVLSLIQTFVFIPLIIKRWGKGAYCGWICSCGALAETMGDTHRHKMPHGPVWNKLNMTGQVILVLAFVLLALRAYSWAVPSSSLALVYDGMLKDWKFFNYKYIVDVWIAGIIGVGFYFHFSGRVWCRFACPLAALMHIYARFSQFRILVDKKKCISCNVCTSVCHQGIDVMNFANKGIHMEDPECVRCSACVQSCPTGVLSFGRVDRKTGKIIASDSLAASPVLMNE